MKALIKEQQTNQGKKIFITVDRPDYDFTKVKFYLLDRDWFYFGFWSDDFNERGCLSKFLGDAGEDGRVVYLPPLLDIFCDGDRCFKKT